MGAYLPTSTFNAQRIAQALGLSKRAVTKRLADIQAEIEMVKGQPAKAWKLSNLPLEWQEKCADLARRMGCRGAEHLLSVSNALWQPEIPLAQCAAEAVAKAAKLQNALAVPITRRNDTSLSATEFEALGLREYQAVFGYTISARHWREVLDRTLARDAGREDWSRLEIYLEEKPARAFTLPKQGPDDVTAHLQDVVMSFGDPAAPSEDEIRLLWHEAFTLHQSLIEQGGDEKRIRKAILKYLLSRPYSLAKNIASLRKIFARNLRSWMDNTGNPEALRDGRKSKQSFALSQSDLDTLTTRALQCGGRVSQAYRECRQQGMLSAALMAAHPANASKSYVPSFIRAKLGPEVKRLMPYHRGPREHILNGPSLHRDPESLFFGDIYQADDTTPPIRWVDLTDPARPRVVRGQLLVMIDVATTKILSTVLIPAAQYSAKHILLLMQKTCKVWGLPRVAWHFENGLWKRAKLVKGTTTALSEGELRLGFKAEFGVDFVHARLPRAKRVEKVIGLIQNHMERLTGYIGRDERYDRFERTQKHLQRTESVNDQPSSPDEFFMTYDEWCNELDQIVSRYNREPQEGDVLKGMSPNEAAHARENRRNPQIVFDSRCDHLLMHYKSVRMVSSKGIEITRDKATYSYCSGITGALVGEQVLVWENLEDRSYIIITDLDKKNPITIPAQALVKYHDESPEVLARENAKINGHLSYARDRYQVVKPDRLRPFRQNVISPDVVATGEEMARQREEVKTKQETEAKHLAKAQKHARQADVDVVLTNPARQGAALETLARLKQKHTVNQ